MLEKSETDASITEERIRESSFKIRIKTPIQNIPVEEINAIPEVANVDSDDVLSKFEYRIAGEFVSRLLQGIDHMIHKDFASQCDIFLDTVKDLIRVEAGKSVTVHDIAVALIWEQCEASTQHASVNELQDLKLANGSTFVACNQCSVAKQDSFHRQFSEYDIEPMINVDCECVHHSQLERCISVVSKVAVDDILQNFVDTLSVANDFEWFAIDDAASSGVTVRVDVEATFSSDNVTTPTVTAKSISDSDVVASIPTVDQNKILASIAEDIVKVRCDLEQEEISEIMLNDLQIYDSIADDVINEVCILLLEDCMSVISNDTSDQHVLIDDKEANDLSRDTETTKPMTSLLEEMEQEASIADERIRER